MLNELDKSLIKMLESLLGKEVEVQCLHEHYTLRVDCKDKDANYIRAMRDSIRGKIGDRIKLINDYPKDKYFVLWIKYGEETPELIKPETNFTERNKRIAIDQFETRVKKLIDEYSNDLSETDIKKSLQLISVGYVSTCN